MRRIETSLLVSGSRHYPPRGVTREVGTAGRAGPDLSPLVVHRPQRRPLLGLLHGCRPVRSRGRVPPRTPKLALSRSAIPNFHSAPRVAPLAARPPRASRSFRARPRSSDSRNHSGHRDRLSAGRGRRSVRPPGTTLGDGVRREHSRALQSRLGPGEVQIAEDVFIGPIPADEREGSMIFSNHCCDPNIGVQEQIVFVAGRRQPRDARRVRRHLVPRRYGDCMSWYLQQKSRSARAGSRVAVGTGPNPFRTGP